MTCAKELQGTVELGVSASGLECCFVKIDLNVGRDAFTLDDLLVECERCHRWQVDIDGCLTAERLPIWVPFSMFLTTIVVISAILNELQLVMTTTGSVITSCASAGMVFK